MKLLSKWHIIGIIFISIIYIIDMPKIINTYLYYKNGSQFDINHHRIEFAIGHWAYFGESKIAYVLSGQTVDGHNLSAEVFKYSKKIDIELILSKCTKIKKEEYSSPYLEGNIYICSKNSSEIMYFQSEDKNIFIRENDFSSSSSKIIYEYNLLFDAIKLRT